MAARPEITILLKARNEAKAVLSQAEGDVKKYTDTVVREAQKTQVSFKEVATSISGVVTAGFSLYSMYENIERQQLMVKRATNTLEDAQRSQKSTLEKLNEAIAKHGENSEEARKAQELYEAKCKDVELAQEKLNYAQNNLNEAFIRAATFAIPSLITFLDRGKVAYEALKKSIDAATISQAAFKGSLLVSAGAAALPAAALVVSAAAAWQFQQRVDALGKEQKRVFDEMTKDAATYGEFAASVYQHALEVAEAYTGIVEELDKTESKWVQRTVDRWKAVEQGLKGYAFAWGQIAEEIVESQNKINEACEDTSEYIAEVVREARARFSEFEEAQKRFAEAQKKVVEEYVGRVTGIPREVVEEGRRFQELMTSLQAEMEEARKVGDWRRVEMLRSRIEGELLAYQVRISAMQGTRYPGAVYGYQVPEGAAGWLVKQPTLGIIGEKGPEIITTPRQLGGTRIENLEINFNVTGSLDKRAAEYAADLVEKKLKSVIIEPTSANAATKRLRDLRGT